MSKKSFHVFPLSSLLDRPYVRECAGLREELEIMSERGAKAEIQSSESPTRYVLEKIAERHWV